MNNTLEQHDKLEKKTLPQTFIIVIFIIGCNYHPVTQRDFKKIECC